MPPRKPFVRTVDAVADGSIASKDPSVYNTIPQRVFLPED